MEKSKNFVSRKFTVDECNSNPNVHFNRCKKEPKPSVLAPLAPPGRFELPTFRLGVLPSLSLLISKHLKLVENVTKNELILPYLCP